MILQNSSSSCLCISLCLYLFFHSCRAHLVVTVLLVHLVFEERRVTLEREVLPVTQGRVAVQ